MSSQALAPTRQAASSTFTPPPAAMLQRSCDCGQHTVAGGECEECKKKETTLQRYSDGSAGTPTAPPIVHDVLRSPGQALDSETRAFFEPRFGQDFSQVRVHADARAAESARAVNALAYTVAQDVVFGSGQYSPADGIGKHLLAHELTHVVQQRNLTRSSARVKIGEPDDAYEQEADMHAAAVAGGNKSRTSLASPELRVQRSFWGAVGGALRAIGTALLDVVLFVPRLFGLEFFPAADLRKYLAGLKERKSPENGIFSDNKARACVSRENELGPYDTQTKILLTQEMLGGYTSFLDEGAIITLLRRSRSDLQQIVSAVGRDRLWSKFSGRNRRIIEAMTLTAGDAGDALVSRLRNLDPSEIQDYTANATDAAVKESVRRAAALANITAPVPTEATITPSGEANFTINGVNIIVRPDRINPALDKRALTYGRFGGSEPAPLPITPDNADQLVGQIPPIEIHLEIWTEFPSEESKEKPSGYGVGTRPQDKNTLRYHERAHGEGWINFVKNNPPPVFGGKDGMTTTQFNTALEQWKNAMDRWRQSATEYALKAGDCVAGGKFPTTEQLAGTGFTAAICHQD